MGDIRMWVAVSFLILALTFAVWCILAAGHVDEPEEITVTPPMDWEHVNREVFWREVANNYRNQ